MTIEDKAKDLRPGTEKKIHWARADQGKTKFGIAYLHGFSASRDEISPVLDGIDQNIFFTRFTGHGQTSEALAKARVEDWEKDVEEAVSMASQIGEQVVLIGTSTGAALALKRVFEKANIAGLILISPNFAPKDKRANLFLWPGGLWLAKWLTGPTRSWEPKNAEQARIWTNKYPLEAVASMMKVTDKVSHLDYSKLSIPLLVLYTDKDESVDVDLIVKNFAKFGGRKKLVNVEGATEHVLAGNATCPQTVPLVRKLIQEFLKTL